MRPRRPGALPLALAICVHLLALLALGWRIPTVAPPQILASLPPVEVQLVRPAPGAAARSAAPVPPAAPGRPSPSRPGLAEPALPSAPAAAPPAPAVAAGAPDCTPEDLPLLTDAEKALCRNQIDADNARRLARGADDKAARQIAEAQRGPQTYRMDADKEAAYDASAHPAPLAPHLQSVGPGVSCGQVTFPLLSGVEINPNLFAKKHKQEHPSHGSMKCHGHM